MTNNLISMDLISKKPWTLTTDGNFKHSLCKKFLEDDMPQESIDEIFSNAVKMLSYCPDPMDTSPCSKTAVVIGKVQSGKTSNFIALTSLSFDNNYDITIVLGGYKINLLKQNTERIEQYYKDLLNDKVVVLSTGTENKSLLKPSTIKSFLSKKKKIIIVGLKHAKHIHIISNLFKDEFLANTPSLIIDDEGDQATLNTLVTKAEMSSIYSAAIGLKKKILRHVFFSITATPQANILIQTFDKLSPDTSFLIYPGRDYCGLLEFHGDNDNTYIRTISNKESTLIQDGIPPSFIEALSTFFVGSAIRKYRGDHRKHSMLIHPSNRKDVQNEVVEKVTKLLEDWKKQAEKSKTNDISLRYLRSNLKNAYFKFKEDGLSLPGYDELDSAIMDAITECSPPHICNSSKDETPNAKFYDLNIFVGGNMMERGITLKGLAVTYIIRRAKGKANVDNTEQRARWFGYKKSFLDVCRVYTTEEIKKDFKAILEHDEDLWASVKRAQDNGTPFKELLRLFILSNKNLELTRKNVAKSARFSYREWIKQDKLISEKEISKSNDNILNDFRKKYHTQIEDYNFNGVNKHKIIRNLDFMQLQETLLDKFTYPVDSNFSKTRFKEIVEIFKKLNEAPRIDIVWMRYGTWETRALDELGRINQLFQGRNPDMNALSYYPGDAAMVDDRPGVMQLQIHYIKPNNRPEIDYYSLAIALYIPLIYAEKMEKHVARDDRGIKCK